MNAIIQQATDTITITCTLGDLYLMQSNTMAVYATPSTDGQAMQCYLAARPQFKYDFIIATLDDFLTEAGWDSLSEEPEEGSDLDEIHITVPRDQHARRGE